MTLPGTRTRTRTNKSKPEIFRTNNNKNISANQYQQNNENLAKEFNESKMAHAQLERENFTLKQGYMELKMKVAGDFKAKFDITRDEDEDENQQK